MKSLAFASVLVSMALGHPLTAQDQTVSCDAPDLRLESHFWTNLHHFLYLLAQQEMRVVPDRPTVRAAIEDYVSASLSHGEEEAWSKAIAIYRSDVATTETWAAPLTVVQARLAATPDDQPPQQLPIPSLNEALSAAAPVYRRHWWPKHDAANRAWIEEMRTLNARYGSDVANRMSNAFQSCWPAVSIAVEIEAHVTFYGAFQQDDPPMLNLSSTYAAHQGSGGFEQLYHEAGHVLDDRLYETLRVEVRRQNRTHRRGALRELTHAILFYTAGDAVRRSLPDHVPYAIAHGIWTRSPGMQELLTVGWQPYLDGEIDFAEAVRRLVAGLP